MTETGQIVLPTFHFQQRIHQQYDNVPAAIVREFVQNSTDAGALNMWMTTGTHSCAFWDDGHGMSFVEWKTFWAHLGGSLKKLPNPNGFMGAAKELVLAWDEWMIESQNWRVIGHGAAEWRMERVRDWRRGFYVYIQDDGSAHDGNPFPGDKLLCPYEELIALSNLPATAHYNGEPLETRGHRLTAAQRVRQYPWGTLYSHKSSKNWHDSPGHLYLRTRGLFTARWWVGGSFPWYLEIDAAHARDVLADSRDTIKSKYREPLTRDIRAMTETGREEMPTENPTITLYGVRSVSDDSTTPSKRPWAHAIGGLDTHTHEDAIWAQPAAIVHDGGKTQYIKNGTLRPKYATALGIWAGALAYIAGIVDDIDYPIPGLYNTTDERAVACHTPVGNKRAICVVPQWVLDAPAYAIVDAAIHEYTHDYASGHTARFEWARLATVTSLGDRAVGAIQYVQMLKDQARKFR